MWADLQQDRNHVKINQYGARIHITQATPSMTGVRGREGRSSSVFAFVEGGKGSTDAVVVSFFDPFARSLHF